MESAFEIRFDLTTKNRIAYLLEVTEGYKTKIRKQLSGIYFYNEKETELCIQFLGTVKLTVVSINLINQRKGTFTKIVNLLIDFCIDRHIAVLDIQSVGTIEMVNFCNKNNFLPVPNTTYVSNGTVYGDYR